MFIYSRLYHPCCMRSSIGKIRTVFQSPPSNNYSSVLKKPNFVHAYQISNRWKFSCGMNSIWKQNFATQKVISPVTTKRQVPKRRIIADSSRLNKSLYDVHAYSTAEEIKLENLEAELVMQGLYVSVKLPDDVDALHLESMFHINGGRKDVFIMRDGSVVFWNMPDEVERNAVLRFVKPHQIDSYDDSLIFKEFEHMNYRFTAKNTDFISGVLTINNHGNENEMSGTSLQLEKYAFSSSISLSVKLALWESLLEQYVDSVEWVLNDFREGKKLKVSRDFMLKKIGELYSLRNLINLSSGLLDVPDFFWERENLEPLHNKICNHLNIRKRTNVINEKISFCSEFADLIISELNDKHHLRLEWMIIILILIEVIFEVLHTVERYWR